jgi:hypothetical protein
MCDNGFLEEGARLIRKAYEDLHHPDVFRRTLRSIVAGEHGVLDPDKDERDQAAVRWLIGSLEKALIAGGEAIDRRFDQIVTEGRSQRRESEDAAERTLGLVQSLQGAVIAKGEVVDRRLDEIAADGNDRRREWEEAAQRTQGIVRSLEEAMVASGERVDRRLELVALEVRAQRREWENWLQRRRSRWSDWLSRRSRRSSSKSGPDP